MDEAKDIIESLRLVQEQIAGRRDPVNAFNRIEVAIDLIQRLAAEVERLRPRHGGMTIQEAVKVLNDYKYAASSTWNACYYDDYETAENEIDDVLTGYEAIAVAEKLLREKEAGIE